MAKPWVDGSTHSTLYGATNCKVIKENIYIKLINKDDICFSKFKIKYSIYSNVNQTVPLLFIGIGLSDRKLVTINNIETQIKKYNTKNTSKISFSKNDSLSVNEDDLIYFDANLKEGENTIYVEYDADMEFNTTGFIRTYKLNYSLYPSKFWESFGPIKIDLFLGENLRISSSNIGEAKIQNKTAYWEIKTIKNDIIELEISNKTNIISDILLFLNPIGISFMFLVIMFIYHTKLLIEKHKQKNLKYNSILSLGIIIIPILFYVVFFYSFSLIDYTLGQEKSSHGYTFLFIFTLPFLIIIYGIIIWLFDRKLKLKHSTTNNINSNNF